MKKRSVVFPRQIMLTRENEGEGEDEYLNVVTEPGGIEDDQPVAFYQLVEVKRMKITRQYAPVRRRKPREDRKAKAAHG